jgi:predicted Ser/Thr protein kinase
VSASWRCPTCGSENPESSGVCSACGSDIAGGPTHPGPADGASGGSAPLVGKTIGRYQVEALLGRGGMGVVYRATDGRLGRKVALKVLAPARAGSKAARERFVREARAASTLDHPGIGTIYEIDEQDGALFIAMALYEGETLRERIVRATLPAGECERIVTALAEALAAAHRAGVVHRDLKPANVMLTSDGQIKLLDFGLAKLLKDETQPLTEEGAVLGTLSYMAPEQVRGEPVDARADLWALGALTYELLCGRPAFAGDRVQTAMRIVEGERTPLSRLAPAAPPHLQALVDALLSTNAASRPNAQQVLERLRTRAVPRPRARIWLALGAGLLAAAGAVTWGVLTREPAVTPLEPVKVAVVADLAAPAPDLFSTDPKERATAHYERATAYFDQGNFAAASDEFLRSYELSGDPAILFNAAQSLRLKGQPALALSLFRATLADKRVTGPMRTMLKKKIADLEKQQH